jgi:hypothetical protein
MAIRAYVGDKYTALSTDTKPLNVDSGATLYELDTETLWLKKGDSWVCLNCATNSNYGSVGPTGPVGPAGQQGIKGDRGIPGSNGIQGIPGPIGENGPTGENGQRGYSCICPYYWWGPFSSDYPWGVWFLWRDYDRVNVIQDVGVHIFWGITWSGSISFINSPNIRIITMPGSSVTLNNGNFVYNGTCYQTFVLGTGVYDFISTPGGIIVLNNMLQNSVLGQFYSTKTCADPAINPIGLDATALDRAAEYGVPFDQLATQYVVRQTAQSAESAN